MQYSEKDFEIARVQAKEIWKLLDYIRGASPISEFRSLAYSLLFIRYMQAKTGQHFNAPRFYSFSEIANYISMLTSACVELDLFNELQARQFSEHIERVLLNNDNIEEENVRWAVNGGFNDNSHAVIDLTLTVLNNLFSENETKSGSEFYTPNDINTLVAQLAINYTPTSICDPFAGSGGTVFSFFENLPPSYQSEICIDTQEMNQDAYFQVQITRIIKGIRGTDYLGDSLSKPEYSNNKYDLIASFPPFGLKIPKEIRSDIIHKDSHPFLYLADVLPNSRSDWFTSLSMLSSLKPGGKLICGMTLAAFTRGGSESYLRESLVKKNIIETVILLPKGIHYSTTVSTVLVIMNAEEKHYIENLPVKFVDASLFYVPKRGRNILSNENIKGIVDSCNENGRFSYSASLEEIQAKEFNLDPTLYVSKTIKINNLTLNNFRGYKKFKLSINNKLTVLVGENGSGKTSILEAIACGLGPFLTAMPDAKGKLIRNSDIHIDSKGIADLARISIDTVSSLSWDLATKGANKTDIAKVGTAALSDFAKQIVDLDEEYPLIAYYGTNRTLSANTGKVLINPFEKEARGDGYDSALDAKINYNVIKNWFSKIEVDELKLRDEKQNHQFVHPAKNLIQNTVKSIVERTDNVTFDKDTNDVVVSWKNEENQTISLSLEQLSEGYRNMVALTIDLVRRAYLLNPKSNDPLNVSGIVLIDEIELHLHPRWQQKVLSDLTNLFKNIQFIVTTHSPQILTTVKGEAIRVVSSAFEQAELVSSPFGGESNRVLLQVLGVEARPKTIVSELLARYFALIEDGKGEGEDALELRKRLNELTDSTEPKLDEADLAIKRVKWMKSRNKQ